MTDKRRRSSHWPDWPTFIGEGETWLLRQVMFDAGLPPHAPRIANAIRMSVNFTVGVAEVSVGKIAAVLGLSDDTVTRCIAALKDRGHIALAAGRGRGNVHRIGWTMKAETRTGTFAGLTGENITGLSGKAMDRLREMMGEENTAAVRGFDEENTAEQRGFSAENPAEDDVKPRNLDPKTPQGCGTYYPLNNLSNGLGGKPPNPRGGKASRDDTPDAEPGDKEAPSNPRQSPTSRQKEDQVFEGEVVGPEDHAPAFEALWSNWPKKAGRSEAQAAFADAIHRGANVDNIMRGAAAYIADRRMDKRGAAAVVQFTTPLGRWLRDATWEAWFKVPDAEALRASDHYAEDLQIVEAAFAARKAMPF